MATTPLNSQSFAPQGEEDVYVFPASYAQERLWFLDQFEPNSPFYNIPCALRITGRLNVDAFKKALDSIEFRHETFRTTFMAKDGRPVQLIAPSQGLPLPLVDLCALPGASRLVAALELLTEDARTPFNLAKGQLIRAKLVRLAPEDHIAILTAHHIISDGWSMGVLVSELSALYQAFAAGQPSPLPPLAIQYADYAEWQRKWLQGPALQTQLSYWKQQLSGAPVLELPTDMPRPAVQSSRGASYSFETPGQLFGRLVELSRQSGTTLFMTLLAAFQLLLSRYSGQRDICVGSPIANRNRPETEPLIGYFANTIVLRTRLDGDPTVRQLLGAVRETTMDAFAHQDLPFELIVEALQPERVMSHTPLFQVMFILQNAPARVQRLPGLTFEQVDIDTGTSTFDLTLSVSEQADGLQCSVEYCTDLFFPETIERLAGHYRTLLQSIVDNPEQRISAIPMLSIEERCQLLSWNPPVDETAPAQLVHQLFEAQAARTPDATAVIAPASGERVCYGELNRRANRLARHLRGLGAGPDVPVAIYLERSPEAIVSVLAVLKSGAAYVPLDVTLPAERVARVLEECGAPVVITRAALREVFAASQARVVLTGDDLPDESDADLANIAGPENLAYVIYTSGSTGKPKGVMVRHWSLANAYRAWESSYELRSLRVHLQMASFGFDVFSGDLVRALLSGGTLVLCPRDLLLEPAGLYQLIREHEVDCAEFVPAVLRPLAAHLEGGGLDLSFMRLLVCGSDTWSVGDHRAIRRLCGPETRLINSFGVTEATIDSTFYDDLPSGFAPEQPVPIGKPFANTELFVLDDALDQSPVGIPGELYIGGTGVARGYLTRPDLTAERFLPNRLGRPGSRMYKTGDRARYLPNGDVEFLGRVDYQVKIRGYRIEPGEVEAALTQHEEVLEAAVAAHGENPETQFLAAHVVKAPGSQAGAGDLKRFLKERLPEYMVPSVIVFLEGLPLNANGKVDRRALPAPERTREDLALDFVPPRTPTEEIVASVFAQVLGIPAAGIYDNFFDLGGHSLLATQVISRIRNAFEVDLPLRRLFEAPTVALLSEHVELALKEAAGIGEPRIEPRPRTETPQLSFAQQRLWFLEQLEPGTAAYNVPECVRLVGPLNAGILERCLNEVVRRHEVLRTAFTTEDGQPRAVVADSVHVTLAVTDYTGFSPDSRERVVLEAAASESSLPFDLARPPLFRIRLLKLSDLEHVVLLVMHHIVSDDWSTTVLIRELAVLYDSFAAGLPSPLPELDIQYRDYALWQRRYLSGETLDRQLSYWKQALGGAPPSLALPTDRPRPAVQTFPGDYVTSMLPPALVTKLRDLGRTEGATLFMTLMAALYVVLQRYSNQNDITVGTPVANRNRSELEGLIGFFVNTLVLRADLSGNPRFRELIVETRKSALDAYAHQDVPFEMIVDAVQPKRDLSHSPLFQVMFALQNTPLQQPADSASGLGISSIPAHSGTAKFDLTFFASESEGSLSLAIEYNTDLFDRTTVNRMMAHYRNLLEAVVEQPDAPIGNLRVLDAAERQEEVTRWNRTEEPVPDLCFAALFEQQVESTPDAIAATYGGQSLSYRELNLRANCLAKYLRVLGIGPGTLAGIAVERSLEMVVGVLGVLKAGAAYVPLDPGYPRERLSFLISDSRISVLLTQRKILNSLPADGVQAVCLDTAWPDIAAQPGANAPHRAGPDDLAYVIYTSGSTGKPKGVMVTQHGLVNYLAWCRRAYPLAVGKSAPLYSSFAFDLTITALLAPLATGSSVDILPEDLGIEVLAAALSERGGYGLVKITPAHLQLLGQQLTPEQARRSTAAFIIGGENLRTEHISFWQRHAPGAALINEYGPTETVVGCCVYQAGSDEIFEGAVPIGKPIINTQLYVLDRNFEPVPQGVAGELYIGGAGVARGYLNRPELTAERFVPDPFSGTPGARLYSSGDLCRRRADGNLECLGRVDDQVKVRGFRVELGEIEAVLGKCPAIRDAAVITREERGERQLVAYCVPAGGALRVADLRSYLKERLPEYMVPAVFVEMAELPLTGHGKVDRKALPAPDSGRPDLETAFAPAETGVERRLAAIWAEVLGLERIGIHDDFFELGGDSILVIQIVARANQAGLHFTPKQLFQHPTVAGLAAVAAAARTTVAEQGPVEGPVPLTPIQRWFFARELQAPHHYNQSVLLDVPGGLERSLVEGALNRLVEHHDALRLRFRQVDGTWRQHSEAASDPVPVAWHDLSGAPPDEQARIIEQVSNEVQAGLDLARGPIMRAAYFDLGAARGGRLLVVIHHLAVDAVSWRILLEDFDRAYGALRNGQAPDLPPKTSSYRQWAGALERYQATGLEYWSAAWRGGEGTLPRDFKGRNTEDSAGEITVSLDEEDTRRLAEEVPAASRTEVNQVLLAALGRTLSEATGSPVVVVDVESHGREEIEDTLDISRTVGWFTAIYPLRLEAGAADWPYGAVNAVKDALRRVPASGIGYGVLRYIAAAEALTAQPAADVCFNYLGQLDRGAEANQGRPSAQVTNGVERSPGNQRSHAIEVDGGIAGGRLEMRWTYSSALHRRETVQALADTFIETVRELIAHCASGPDFSEPDFEVFGWTDENLKSIAAEIGGKDEPA